MLLMKAKKKNIDDNQISIILLKSNLIRYSLSLIYLLARERILEKNERGIYFKNAHTQPLQIISDCLYKTWLSKVSMSLSKIFDFVYLIFWIDNNNNNKKLALNKHLDR